MARAKAWERHIARLIDVSSSLETDQSDEVLRSSLEELCLSSGAPHMVMSGLTDEVGEGQNIPNALLQPLTGANEVESLALLFSGVTRLRDGISLNELELVALRQQLLPQLRPLFIVQDDTFEAQGSYSWLNDRKDVLSKELFASIGCIQSESAPYGDVAGTGFLVGPRLLMTCRHVAERFIAGVGRRTLTLNANEGALCDLRQEWRQASPARRLTFERAVLMHPYWDIAILEVSGELDDLVPLRLCAQAPEARFARDIALIGFPVKEYLKTPEEREERDRLFGGIFGIKRLQPGRITRATQAGTQIPRRKERRMVRVIGHDASTLAGNSGSAVIDLKDGAVLGIHFGGKVAVGNYAVPAWELLRDTRVQDLSLTITEGEIQPPDPAVELAWREHE